MPALALWPRRHSPGAPCGAREAKPLSLSLSLSLSNDASIRISASWGQAIYTSIGGIVVAVNPYQRLEGLYTEAAMDRLCAADAATLESRGVC